MKKQQTLAVVTILLSYACSWALAQTSAPSTQPRVINITERGAVGDGTTLNTAAIQSALNAISARGGGEVVVPAGNFLTGSIVIGPRTTLRLEKDSILTGSPNKEDYPIINVRWEGEWRPGHRSLIFANHVDHIGVVGEGKIVGPPQALANLRPNANSGNARGPSIIEPIECRDVRLEGFSLQYGRMWNIHLTYCQDVVIRNLFIRSTIGVSNGDGIDVDSCKNVLIEGCDIQTGDDAIAIKSGRSTEAWKIARPTDGVLIRNCKLSCPRFACVAVGSEMSGGVRNVRIEDCIFTESSKGIFIKGRNGRAGFIENITGDGIEVAANVNLFLHFEMLNTGIAGYEPVQGIDGVPHVANISFSNVKSQPRRLVNGTGLSSEKPLDGLRLTNISGTCLQAIDLANAKNVVLKNISVTGYEGEFLRTRNVTGSNIDKIKEPKDTVSQ